MIFSLYTCGMLILLQIFYNNICNYLARVIIRKTADAGLHSQMLILSKLLTMRAMSISFLCMYNHHDNIFFYFFSCNKAY